jgi:hypothetical protein
VLDNNLLYQSRQRGLELDFETLNVIGLENFGLELLDKLRSYCGRIGDCMGYLLKREAYRSGIDDLRLESQLKGPKDVVHWIGVLSRNTTAEDGEIPLMTIQFSSEVRVGADVLGEIMNVFYRLDGQLHWLKVEPPERDPEGRIIGITFLPNANLISKGDEPYAKIVIRETAGRKETDKPGGLELVWAKAESSQPHDLRLLWNGVKVLEDVLKTAEATAGGISDDESIGG